MPKPIAPDVWIVDGPEIDMNFVGLTAPFSTRMTVVRLADGALWLHSPTQPDDALVDRVAAVGAVRYLVAPNPLHYWWIGDWKARFPAASVYAFPGLERTAKRPLPVDASLGDRPPPEWHDAIDQVLIRGRLFGEAGFFHRASRTLILTDLIENFETGRIKSRFYRWLVRAAGATDPDGKAPLDMRLSFLGRRRALRAAVRRMIEWRPERIVLAHGRWYERDATSELARAFRWVL